RTHRATIAAIVRVRRACAAHERVRDAPAHDTVGRVGGLHDAPLFSVVIAARDAAGVLEEQLDALAAQTYRGAWELVVADHGSVDRTASIARAAASRFPHLRIVDASGRRGPGGARNAAAAVARGEFLCFVDADDRVDVRWLESLARNVEGADALGGQVVAFGVRDGGRETTADRGFDALPTNDLGFLPNATTANMCVRRRRFEEIGAFDDSFRTGEDIDLSWRLQLAGCELRFAPDALVLHRERDGLTDLARQFFRYGEAMPQLFRKFRHLGMPRSSPGESMLVWLRAIALAAVAWRSERTRRGWVQLVAQRAGRISGSVKARVLYL
ncbi:MAG TPA: glycosyltransferase, partial [Acidimicrobiia bacterium]|nr:glycosyltransferase [Acidimicrobiia bacterium]